MQTTQKRQEDDVNVRRAAGPLHFVDANAQAMATGPFPQPAFQQVAPTTPNQAISLHNPYGAQQTIFGVPQLVWGAQAPAFPSNAPIGPANVAYGQQQPPGNVSQGLAQRVPACDIVDEGGEYVCQVELPGVKRENVDVSCFERALLVTAHSEPEIDVGALVLSERGSTASFRRTITLPSDIQTAEAKATLRDGILTINLPKARPTAGPKRIPVA